MPVPSPRNPISPARGNYVTLLANIADLSEGELVWAGDQNQLYVKEGSSLVTADTALPSTFTFINQKSDFPTAIGGVITLADNQTYFITSEVDLTGDRLVAGQNTTILGASSENCRLKSTGLTGTALLTSQWTIPIRHITFEADVAINLDATGNDNQAIDWYGVNFTDCGTVGLVKNYGNFIINSTAFLNSAGLTFDGTIGTIAISNTLLSGSFDNDLITFASTLQITGRFRQTFSSVIPVGSAAAGYRVQNGAIIPDEGFILFECNFVAAAGSTIIDGLGTVSSSNKILSKGCVGIDNTSVNGQMYMQNNATATVISSQNTFVKVAGVTTASADNAKYLHANNRLTNDAVRTRKYLIQASLSFVSGNSNECEFGFFDSELGAIRTPSRTRSTANSSGRAENVSMMCVVNHMQGDYIEVWCANNSTTNNITVEDLNVTITQVG